MATTDDKKRINDEKKELKRQQKLQKKEAKRRAKEISKKQVELDESEDGGGISTFLATIFIVIVWLAVICVIIKLDVGSFGSNVLTPLLKDVPVVNLILPGSSLAKPEGTEGESESYGGYSDLKEAVEQIRLLEAELETAQTSNAAKTEEITELRAEVVRLQQYEALQAEFQRIQNQFYEEVVTAEEGPGLEAYREYYESMDPATAEYIYRQVIVQIEESSEIQDYAAAYSEMKPKQAAGIFEEMTSDLDLVARILRVMDTTSRGEILGAMDPEVAAKITKIMDPES